MLLVNGRMTPAAAMRPLRMISAPSWSGESFQKMVVTDLVVISQSRGLEFT